MSDTLVQVEHLQQYFPAGGYGKNKKYIQAVDDVSFTIERGETLGLVGESGCGKTTTGRTLLRLYEPTGGRFVYDGETVFDVEKKIFAPMLPYRKKMQIVFQDPYASLDPRMTVGDIIGEAIDVHKLANSKQERYDIIIEMLRRVGLNSEHANRYPHEFSGGMRQRIVIATAIAADPEVLICDGPTTALDVTLQAQILQLLRRIQRKMGLSVIFITHDLGVVANIADRVAVMYAGDIVEIGTCEEVFYDPKHPYTWALLSSLPQLGIKGQDLYAIKGTPPNLFNKIRGDAFAPRNPQALKIDFEHRPPYFEVSPTHKARTWLLDPRAPKIEPPEVIRHIREIKRGGAQ